MTKAFKKVGRFFWNDKDGYSAQNHALLLFTTPFAIFISIGLIMVLMGKQVEPMYLDLLETLSTPVMVVLGGVFSINVAAEFRKPKKTDSAPVYEEYEYEDATYEEIYPEINERK